MIRYPIIHLIHSRPRLVFWVLFLPVLLVFTQVYHTRPKLVYVGMALAFLAFLMLQKRVLSLAFLIVAMINFFGLVGYSRGAGISIPLPFGNIVLTDILILVFGLDLLRRFYEGKVKWKKTALNKPLFLFFLMVLFQVARAWLVLGEDFHYIFKIARPMIYYSAFFFILYGIKNKHQLEKFLRLCLLIAAVAGAVSVIQVATGWAPTTSAGKVIFHAGVYRTYNVSCAFSAATFSVLFLILLFCRGMGKKLLLIGLTALLGMSILMTFARNLWLSTILALTLGILILGREARRKRGMLLTLLLLSFATIGLLNTARVQRFLYPYRERFASTFTDLVLQTGSVKGRVELFDAKWQLARQTSIPFGVGFQYDPFSLLGAMGADSGVAHMVFRLGLVGVAVFVFLFGAYFSSAISKYRKMPWSTYKMLILGLILVNVQMLLTTPVSDKFFRSSGLIVFVTSWALTELIWKFYGPENKKYSA